MSKYWQNWFSAWAIFVGLFGLVFLGGAYAATDGLTRAFFDVIGSPFPAEPDNVHRFTIGLIGAITVGWGLTYYGMFKTLFAIEPATAAPIWRYLLGALLLWYVIDSGISIATGFWINAVSNTIVVLLFAIPLFKSGAMKG